MSHPDKLQVKLRSEIGELSDSINGLIEAFRKLRAPLEESQQKVPQATSQLDKINEQTEAATHRMLDTVEMLTHREQEIIDGLAGIKACLAGNRVADAGRLVADAEARAVCNLNDAFTIMDALQFQDITSQQMNHAASLLEEIEGKLQHILGVIGVDGTDGAEDPGRKKRAYDPHADLVDNRTRQADIDSLFAEQKVK